MKCYLRLEIIGLFFFACVTISLAQDPDPGFADIRPRTHALIIGISEYKSLENLQFADRDALVFRQYIIETLASRSDTNNIITLLNEKALSPQIYMALENLVELAREGDRVYIYFSGHGDSENTTIFRSGFLLTHDTPEGSYYTNSLNIDILNNFVNTLSVKNKADVFFIADACRSGNLGFSSGTGTEATARALAENVADEVRVLSCQPNEISLEGEQWGNGRGLFSFHLVNGLYGMADASSSPDGLISLNELNIYLSTNVPRDAAPVSQYPGIYGPMNKQIASVNETSLERWIQEHGTSKTAVLSKTKSKGYEEQFTTGLNDEQKELFRSFHASLKKGRLDKPESASAWTYYMELQRSDIDPVLESLIRRDLAAALQQEAQLFIHQLADVHIRWKPEDMKYEKWSRQMKLSADLLGEGHYLYETLMGKHYFFASANLYFKARNNRNANEQRSEATEAARLINLALKADPNVIAYHNLKGVALNLLNYSGQAVEVFDDAIRLNPDYPYPYSNKGWALIKLGRYEEALSNLDRCIELDPPYTNAYQYKITALKKLDRDAEAMEVYRQIIQISSGKVGM